MSQAGRFGSGTGAPPIETLTGNMGLPVGPDGAGNIDIFGDGTVIIVTGTPASNLLTITAAQSTTTNLGVIELATDAETIAGVDTQRAIVPSSLAAKLGVQTQFALPYGDTSSNALLWTAAGSDGQIPIGATGAAPVFANIISTGGTISITNGANSIDLDTGATIADEFDGDSGTAQPSLGVLTIAGGTGITTSAAGSTVTVDLDTPVAVTNGGTSNTTFTAYSVLCAGTTATGAFQNVSGLGSAGQVLTSQGAASLPQWDSLTPAFAWNEETGTSANMVVNNGYIPNNAGLVTLTLPATAAIGDVVRVSGKGSGGWQIAQNASQTIYFGSMPTTTGVGGSLSSTNDRDSIELVCVTANNDWNVLSSIGNIAIL